MGNHCPRAGAVAPSQVRVGRGSASRHYRGPQDGQGFRHSPRVQHGRGSFGDRRIGRRRRQLDSQHALSTRQGGAGARTARADRKAHDDHGPASRRTGRDRPVAQPALCAELSVALHALRRRSAAHRSIRGAGRRSTDQRADGRFVPWTVPGPFLEGVLRRQSEPRVRGSTLPRARANVVQRSRDRRRGPDLLPGRAPGRLLVVADWRKSARCSPASTMATRWWTCSTRC